jgi:hypothetical protein
MGDSLRCFTGTEAPMEIEHAVVFGGLSWIVIRDLQQLISKRMDTWSLPDPNDDIEGWQGGHRRTSLFIEESFVRR